jgi:maleamate amidohydrolase
MEQAQAPQSASAAIALHPDECLPGWRSYLTNATESAIVDRYGRASEPGDRVALLLIDFQDSYLGRDDDLLEQLDTHPAASARAGWAAFRNALTVVDAYRTGDIPLVVTRVGFDPGAADDVSFARKRAMPGSFAIGSQYTQLPDALELRAHDALYTKPAASAFFGTALDDFVEEHRIDTLVLTGLSTSGCVRATAVDAAARGIRPIVVVDAVADRLIASHTVSLIDIWMKYGDLTTSEAISRHLARPTRGA